jgi:pimeloyl-ACP methyl ester carboxylesterase
MSNTISTTSTVRVQPLGNPGLPLNPVEVTVDERGAGHPFLLLHGGGGPQTVSGFAELLATKREARVITPIHPGFGGTTRPDELNSVAGLAAVYAGLLEERDLRDVTVVGNSIGGWIAAELALLKSSRVSSVVIVDGVGIEVPGHPVVDFFSLTMDQVAAHSYFNPASFRIDPSALPPAAQAIMARNRAALAVYGGQTMNDPGLAARLDAIAVPTLIIWGEADRIADVEYGRALAAAIPNGQFLLLRGTGHLPQIETPDQLLPPVWDFALSNSGGRPIS